MTSSSLLEDRKTRRADGRRTKILFFSETVTLAHAARPVVLASALDPETSDVTLAWHPRFSHLFPNLSFPTEFLHVIATARFNQALRDGTPFLDTATLRRYVEDDRRLIRRHRPDVVASDFRLSLTISAALEGVPLWTIASPQWSPYAEGLRPLTPENPVVQFLPAGFVDRWIFPWFFRRAERAILAPFQQLRREYGLPAFMGGLRELYTHGDQTLYDGAPDWTPLIDAPPHHRFLGPLLWSPPQVEPHWWNDVPTDRPCVYVNLGTSGNPLVLGTLMEVLGKKNVSVLLATAGGPRPDHLSNNVFVADYLPGEAAAARADLVVCNGGSGAVAQALCAGVPVLGLASNLDQILCMQGVERMGRGVLLRAFQVTSRRLGTTMERLLTLGRTEGSSPMNLAPFESLLEEGLHREPSPH